MAGILDTLQPDPAEQQALPPRAPAPATPAAPEAPAAAPPRRPSIVETLRPDPMEAAEPAAHRPGAALPTDIGWLETFKRALVDAPLEGVGEAWSGLSQSQEALSGRPVTPRPPSRFEGGEWSDVVQHPLTRSLPRLAYNVARAHPSLIGAAILGTLGGFGGGVAGSVVPGVGNVAGATVGTVIGTATGAGLLTYMQEIGPYYAAEQARNPGINQQQAWERAEKEAILAGAVSSASMGLMRFAPFQTAVRNVASQIFLQSGLGAAGQAAQAGLEERTVGVGELANAAASTAAGQAPFAALGLLMHPRSRIELTPENYDAVARKFYDITENMPPVNNGPQFQRDMAGLQNVLRQRGGDPKLNQQQAEIFGHFDRLATEGGRFSSAGNPVVDMTDLQNVRHELGQLSLNNFGGPNAKAGRLAHIAVEGIDRLLSDPNTLRRWGYAPDQVRMISAAQRPAASLYRIYKDGSVLRDVIDKIEDRPADKQYPAAVREFDKILHDRILRDQLDPVTLEHMRRVSTNQPGALESWTRMIPTNGLLWGLFAHLLEHGKIGAALAGASALRNFIVGARKERIVRQAEEIPGEYLRAPEQRGELEGAGQLLGQLGDRAGAEQVGRMLQPTYKQPRTLGFGQRRLYPPLPQPIPTPSVMMPPQQQQAAGGVTRALRIAQPGRQ